MTTFPRDLWSLIRPYWRSRERWASGALLAAVIGLDLGAVYVSVLFNDWNNLFYNALQEKNRDAFTHQFIRFGWLAAIFLAVAVYRQYLRQALEIRWRRWLTEHLVGAWLEGRAFYRLPQARGGADNPDQRIADDVGDFVGQTLSLGLGLLDSLVTLASFTTILWGLSGALDLGFMVVPGYMVWVALIYALGGSWLINRIGRPLIGLNFRQQQREADFRFALVRLRENAESVAFLGGEARESRTLAQLFAHVVENWWQIMRRQKRLTWFSAGYGQIAVVFPYVVAAPRFFSGAMELGGLMQTAQAFGQVQGALSWFIDAYASLAAWRATAERLIGFCKALDEARAAAGGDVVRQMGAGHDLRLRKLTLDLPDGTPLLSGLDLDLPAGGRVLVVGPSGCGKSTLLRALGGLWRHGTGQIVVPAGQRLLFLPQKPYLPIGPLRQALTYPASDCPYDDSGLRQILAACRLEPLGDRLNEDAPWGQILSPGEQQRLGIARALLVRPDWLFLDEATSALDPADEAALYRLLTEALPVTTLVSVGHRPELAAFHSHRLDLGAHAPRLAALAPGAADPGGS